MSVTPPEIISEGTSKPEVVSTENFTELLFNEASSGGSFKVSSDTAIASKSGATVDGHTFTATPSAGEQVKLAVTSTKVKSSTFAVEGEGAMKLQSKNSKLIKSTITGGDDADSVKFKGTAVVKESTTSLGAGDDSIVYGKKVKLKGEHTIDLGEGGADTVRFKGGLNQIKGEVTITNFDENDTLIVKGEGKFGMDDLKDTNLEGIKIEFAD